MKFGFDDLGGAASGSRTIRLNRFLALCGLGSRRQVEKFILGGQVKINGQIVRTLAVQVDPQRDEVAVAGELMMPVTLATYLMLNKPVGYVTTAQDEAGRKTIFDLVDSPLRVFPIGRLDRDSEGLLLLTNDGELAHRLMHPRYKVPKVYRVYLNKPLRPAAAKKFQDGIVIDGRYQVHGELRFPRSGENRLCEVTIFEGRNRQVRKMFAALGYRVKALQRTQVGPLMLGKLKPGAWRYLTANEIHQLKKAVNLDTSKLSLV
ncbi:MAG: rRNA pseudouridine synthase [candidate division KSB1 bacterium]|nr:rRNA pseudouridine synthase [candidate division KSB1 bacterium]